MDGGDETWDRFDEAHEDPGFLHEPPERRGRQAVAIALVAALVISTFAIALVVVLQENRADDTFGVGDDDVDPSEVVAPDGRTFDQVVGELKAFVEAERGLKFVDDVPIELLGNRSFEQRLLEDFDDDVDELKTSERVLKALGLIDAEADLVEGVRNALSGAVAGFYDTEENELVVRGTSLGPYERIVFVHELTHALQDQHFELFRPELDDAVDESGIAFSALVEGDASRIDGLYRASMSSSDRREAARQEARFTAGLNVDGIPRVILAVLGFPYSSGPPFVEEVLQAGGLPRLDLAFTETPTTSEQILHADRYLDGEGLLPVEPPPANGDVIDEGVFGALSLALLLGDGLPTLDGLNAVDGWGGDWYVAWDEGVRTCVRTKIVVDHAEGYEPLAAALEAWATTVPDGDVIRDDLGESMVMTSCAATGAVV